MFPPTLPSSILPIEEATPPFYPHPSLLSQYFAAPRFKTDLDLQIKPTSGLNIMNCLSNIQIPISNINLDTVSYSRGPTNDIALFVSLYNSNQPAEYIKKQYSNLVVNMSTHFAEEDRLNIGGGEKCFQH